MGFLDEDYDVRVAEGFVREAEQIVMSRKQSRDTAKQNGNYTHFPVS